MSTGVGDEGGFAPNLPDAKAVLEVIVEAIEKAGYQPGKEVCIALDVAATELYDKEAKRYIFEGEGVVRSVFDMIEYYKELIKEFPIISIEDPLDEEDWEGWEMITNCLGDKVQLVGDDLFVTNRERLQKGIDRKAANAILIKVNQIGSLSEAFETIELAKESGYKTIISHRSGETEDSIIADIAVAFQSGQIKTGAPCRSERVAKYNQLLRIEERM
jgi:enolase